MPADPVAAADMDLADARLHPEATETVPILALVTPLVRRGRFIAACSIIAAVLMAAYSLIIPARFTATTTFMPETPSVGAGNLAGLASLAGQFGLPTGAGGAAATPDLYASVIKSRQLLEAVLKTRFTVPGREARDVPLLDLLEVKAPSPQGQLAAGVKRLSAATTVAVDRRTSILTVSVEMADAGLAADVANELVALVNRYNLERRQSQSRAQREFTEVRLRSATAELREAENREVRFRQSNRTFRGSPTLEVEGERLARVVSAKQEVVVGLSKSYEESRIAEVRDTPLLSVIDTAVPPTLRSFPRRTLLTLLAGFGGLLLGVVLVLVGEFSRHAAGRPAERAELAEAWQHLRRDIGMARKHGA